MFGDNNGESPMPWRSRGLILRIGVTVLTLATWFWTQSLLGARALPVSGIGDGLHQLTAPANAYFHAHPRGADALILTSSGCIDALALFLFGIWLFGRTIRPFLGLFLLLALRQILQALCNLPAPPNMIWHYPGFPSLLVTYSVSSDFFFSGHTAIAVFAATELVRLGKRWLSVLAIVLVLFEITALLILRVHYTMDIFTGILAALWVAPLTERLSPRLNRFLYP
jgi:hypothetical protein